MTNKEIMDDYRIQRMACIALADHINDLRRTMQSPTDDVADRVNDMERTLRARSEALAPIGQRIAVAIASLSDVTAQRALEMRYIRCLDNRTIARTIHYTESGVRGIYHRIIPSMVI